MMKQMTFIFNYVQLLYYKFHKINTNRGGSSIDSPDWIKNKKAIINLINKKDSKCCQYAVTVVLNHEELKKGPQIITKIKPLINKYKWKVINFPSETDDWKTFEKNDLNVYYAKNIYIYI